jgi:hypothetical protein
MRKLVKNNILNQILFNILINRQENTSLKTVGIIVIFMLNRILKIFSINKYNNI